MLRERLNVLRLLLIHIERYLRQYLHQGQLMQQFCQPIKHTRGINHLHTHLLDMCGNRRLIIIINIGQQTDQISSVNQAKHGIDRSIIERALPKGNGLVG